MLNRLLIVSGRYVVENPYRELRLKSLFEERGIEVMFAIPSRQLNQQGYTDNMRKDLVFLEAGAKWLESKHDFKQCLNKCDGVLFGSWKAYGSLTSAAQLAGKPVVNFNTTSGLDFWPHNVDYACVKGPFSKRQTLYKQEILPNHGSLRKDQIIVTGSIIHEFFKNENYINKINMTREGFCRTYQFDPSRPIVTLLPKGIGSFKRKIPKWFLDWNEKQCLSYNQWFLDKYVAICKAVKEAKCNLIVKMHPSAYASYLSSSAEEYAFWQQVPWAKVLAPEHTYPCYEYSDCGVGVSSHSVLDFGYFGKPFIYVDSDQIEHPQYIYRARLNELCHLPPGPSSEWSNNNASYIHPWFPSWLGFFSRVQDLPELLNGDLHSQITPENRDKFVREFWYKADGKAGERIVDLVSNYMESWSASKSVIQMVSSFLSQVPSSQPPPPPRWLGYTKRVIKRLFESVLKKVKLTIN